MLTDIQQAYTYNPTSGYIFYKYNPNRSVQYNNRWVGKRALTSMNTVKKPFGMLNGKFILAATVAWALAYGEYRKDVYTANGDRSDLRLCNLRVKNKLADCL